jgi:hypothetical protein
MFFRHKEIMNLKIIAAGAPETRDMPVIDDLSLRRRENHEADVGSAIRVAARCIPLMDDRIPDRPIAVLDEAAIAPAPTDPIAPGDRERLSGRVYAPGKTATSAENLFTHIFGNVTG